jgi:hypothetical protein
MSLIELMFNKINQFQILKFMFGEEIRRICAGRASPARGRRDGAGWDRLEQPPKRAVAASHEELKLRERVGVIEAHERMPPLLIMKYSGDVTCLQLRREETPPRAIRI